VLVAGFLPRWTGFEPKSGQAGFVVDEAALGQVSSEYFGNWICFHLLKMGFTLRFENWVLRVLVRALYYKPEGRRFETRVELKDSF
jgi:hypothetical protein